MHRSVFPAEQVSHTIYDCHGIHHYLASLIHPAAASQPYALVTAWDNDMVVGYTLARVVDGFWHLNYIAVVPAYQSRGVGRSLWKIWLKTGRERNLNCYSLDVEHSNRGAFEWYKRHGFELSETSWTYEKQLVDSSRKKVAFQLLDWEGAQAWQMAYGFSEFRLALRTKEWFVGRIGEKYFRVRQLLPAAVEQALALLDPRRRLLITTSQPHNARDLRKVSVSVRMKRVAG